MTACPHCGARARHEASALFRWRCGVCGGPVVPSSSGAGAELAELVRAQRAGAVAFGWRAAAALAFAIAVMTAGLALLLWSASHAVGLLLGGLGAVGGAAGIVSSRRAARCVATVKAHLDTAWAIAAPDANANANNANANNANNANNASETSHAIEPTVVRPATPLRALSSKETP